MPPVIVAIERGMSTLEGMICRRLHQLWITGMKMATIGVLGITLESGATTPATRATRLC